MKRLAVVVALTLLAFGPTAPPLRGQDRKAYVCSPCGQRCDERVFDAPGTCPSCGMTLVEKDAGSKGPRLPLAGNEQLNAVWAGMYLIGSHPTAIKLYVPANDGVLEPKLDILAGDGGLAFSLPTAKDNVLTGDVSVQGQTVRFELRADDSSLVGTADSAGGSGPARLIRLAPAKSERLRSYEGLYRAGRRFFACEVLNDYWGLTLTEYPTGIVRGMFPVSETEFVVGRSLMFAVPEERHLTFTADHRLLIREGGHTLSATKVPLTSEDVTFPGSGVTLAGTVIMPPGKGPHPGIVFMHGSGDAPRNTFMGEGYWLASKGFAVLKYDKRGSGQSTGSLERFTYEELGDDGVAAGRFLAGREGVDPKRVGFWGISEGGWTAVIAGVRFQDAAFVVAVSGGGMRPDLGELLDSEDQLRTDGGFGEEEIKAAVEFQRLRDHYMRTGEGWDAYSAARGAAVTKKWWGYPATDLYGPSKPDNPFWKNKAASYFYDPAPNLERLRCPFLGIAGDLDTPAVFRQGNENIHAAMKTGGNRDATTVVLHGATHNMFESETRNEGAGLPLTDRIAPGYIPLLTGWLEKRVRPRPAPRPA